MTSTAGGLSAETHGKSFEQHQRRQYSKRAMKTRTQIEERERKIEKKAREIDVEISTKYFSRLILLEINNVQLVENLRQTNARTF